MTNRERPNEKGDIGAGHSPFHICVLSWRNLAILARRVERMKGGKKEEGIGEEERSKQGWEREVNKKTWRNVTISFDASFNLTLNDPSSFQYNYHLMEDSLIK